MGPGPTSLTGRHMQTWMTTTPGPRRNSGSLARSRGTMHASTQEGKPKQGHCIFPLASNLSQSSPEPGVAVSRMSELPVRGGVCVDSPRSTVLQRECHRWRAYGHLPILRNYGSCIYAGPEITPMKPKLLGLRSDSWPHSPLQELRLGEEEGKAPMVIPGKGSHVWDGVRGKGEVIYQGHPPVTTFFTSCPPLPEPIKCI